MASTLPVAAAAPAPAGTRDSGAVASPAAGQASATANPQGAADVLFQEGRALMSAGRAAEACPKFTESNRLDPATGTLLNLAVCNEMLGKTATAWAQFRLAEVASEADHREDRVTLAREHLAALLPKLSVITVQVSDARRVPGLKLTLDGQSWGEPLWNVPTPIDPGAHSLVAEAPGRGSRVFRADVGPRAQKLLVVVDLPGPPVSTAPTATATAHGPAGGAAVSPRLAFAPGHEASPPVSRAGAVPGPNSVEVSRGPAGKIPEAGAEAGKPVSLTFTLACVAAGIGASALIVGAVYGAQAFSRWDERNTNCPMDVCTTDAGIQAQIGAENAARDANVAVVLGLAALSASGYLFYRWHEAEVDEPTAPPRRWSLVPSLSSRRAGLLVERGW